MNIIQTENIIKIKAFEKYKMMNTGVVAVVVLGGEGKEEEHIKREKGGHINLLSENR